MTIAFGVLLIVALWLTYKVIDLTKHNNRLKKLNIILRQKVEVYKNQRQIIQSVKAINSSKTASQENLTAVLRGVYQVLDNVHGPFTRLSLFSITDGNAKLISKVCKNTSSIQEGAEIAVNKLSSYDSLIKNEVSVVNNLELIIYKSITDQILYKEGIRSYLCKPIVEDKKLIGFINISSNRTEHFTPKIIKTIEEAFEPVSFSFAYAMGEAE